MPSRFNSRSRARQVWQLPWASTPMPVSNRQWRTHSAKWREINPNDPKGQEARLGIEKGLVGLLKGKTPIEFALALVAASQKRQLDRPTVTFLDSIVDQSRVVFDDKDPHSQVVELRLLHQLADQSKDSPPNDWWDMADKAWNTVFIAEQASFQPSTLSWVRPRLVEADASLHDAQVLLLTPQRGYASWKRQIADAWENTSSLYQSVREQQDRRFRAPRTRSRRHSLSFHS